MNKTVRQIGSWVSSVLVGIVVVLAVALVGVRLVGLKPFVVLSGSMEPAYHVGSLIYVKEVDHSELNAGDTITFMANETTVVTHRIAGIVPDEADPEIVWFRTKGDANAAEDGALVHCRNVIGKAVFSIPYLGYAANFIQQPPGLYIALGCGALLLILAFWPTGKKKKKDTADMG